MVKTKEEILELIKGVIGENTDESSIAILEDVSDTLDDYATKTADQTDWKAKYEENDEAWKKKYRDRFFQKSESDDETDEEEEVTEKKTFDDLFKKEEN